MCPWQAGDPPPGTSQGHQGWTLGRTRAWENRPRPRDRLGARFVSSSRPFNPKQDFRVYLWGRKGLGKAQLKEKPEKPSLEGQREVQMKGIGFFFFFPRHNM